MRDHHAISGVLSTAEDAQQQRDSEQSRRYAAAVRALEEGQMYSAEEAFQALLQQDPKSFEARLGLINTQIFLGKPLTVIEAALDPSLAVRMDKALLSMVLLYLAQTGNGRLLEEFTDSIKRFSGDAHVIYLSSLCMRQIGENNAALRHLIALKGLMNQECQLQLIDLLFRMDQQQGPVWLCQALEEISGLKIGRDLDGGWLLYQLARYFPLEDLPGDLPATPAAPVTSRKMSYGSLMLADSREVLKREHVMLIRPAALQRPEFERRIEELVIDIRALAEEDADIQMLLQTIAQIRETHAREAQAPVQIISTGRAGTTTLYDLLSESRRYQPYHSFALQTLLRERLEFLTRIREGLVTREYLKQRVFTYLQFRVAELLYAYRNDRTPVFVSHWDSIFSIINLALFPEMKLLYLDRDAKPAAGSFIGKVQWAYAQLMDVSYQICPESGQFQYRIDSDGDMAKQVGWYQFVTHALAGAVGRLSKPGHYLHLRAEALFRAEEGALEALAGFFDQANLTVTHLRQRYAVPTNQKNERRQHGPWWVRESIEAVPSHYQRFLTAYG